ncbi:phage tail tape measure protein [Enterococcus hermanniensis]|uniref:Phage tail tape measure protein, TP901 family, core region n=1 Tax=Enterococcus hermanniensis TaxID=249189 RepID=A0A1L8TDS0_9ENTE|nr:phage tail tape measure protein [Enterococcus hermanniensis]OJG42440.1 phage tail tape measure protein, TP901 family, core region [Enterococcus hermanniensis]
MANGKPLGNMIIKLDLDSSAFSKGLTGAKNAVNHQMKAMKSQMQIMNSSGNSIGALNAKYEGLGGVLQANEKQVQKLTEAYKNSFDENGNATASTVKYANQLNQAQARSASFESQMKTAAGQMARLKVETEGITGKLKTQSEQWIKSGQKIESFGKKVSSTGTALTVGVTAPIAAGSVAVAKAAISWESAFAGVKKTNDEVVDSNGTVTYSYSDLEAGLRDLAKQLPASHQQIASVAEAAGQLGIKTENVKSFTKTMIDLGESTNMSAETAATSLARFANITQMSQKDFGKLGSAIVELGNNYATTESEITEMSLRIAGAGKQVGMSQGEILGFATALSSVGVEAEAGGSAISKVMIQMQLAVEKGGNAFDELKGHAADQGVAWETVVNSIRDGGKSLKSVAGQMGFTSSELKKMYKEANKSAGSLDNFANVAGLTSKEFEKMFKKDPSQTIMKFIQGLAGAEKQGTSAIKMLDDMDIKEVRLRDSLLRAANASGVFGDAIKSGNSAWKENSALTAEANKRYETTESKLKMLKNEAIDAAIDLGGPFVDALRSGLEAAKPLVKGLGDLAKGFSELSKGQQQSIIKWLGIAAAAGPALKLLGGGIAVFGKTKTAVGNLTGSLVELAAKSAEKKAIAGFTTTVTSVGTASASAAGASGVGALGMAFASLAAPAAIGVGAIGAIGLALYAGKKAYDEYQLSGAKWGTKVTESQDKVIDKSSELREKGIQYMNEYRDGVNANAEKVKEANKGIQKAIEGTLKKEQERREKISELSLLDDETKKWYEQIISVQKKIDNETSKTVKSQIEKINSIYQNASDNNRELTDSEVKFIKTSYTNLSSEQLKAAGFSKAQRLAIETSYQDDLSKLNDKEVSSRIKSLEKALDKEKKSYDKQRKEIENNESLSANVRETLLKNLKKNYKEQTSEMITALGNLSEKSGNSLDAVWYKWEKYGYNVKEVTALVSSSVKDTSKDLSLFAKGTSEADMQWNALSLDPKTGEVKTNMTDVLVDIAKTDDGWNQLSFMAKEAKLTSNAKEEVAIAMGEAGKWDELWLTEKMLLVNGDEAKLELYETINAMGAWNQYVLDRKTLGIDNTDAIYKLFTTENQIKQWNMLPIDQKKLLADNTDLTTKIFASTESYTAWTQLPDNVKHMLADNVDLKTKLDDGTISIEQYNQILPLLKKMYGDNYEIVTKTEKAKNEIDEYNKNHHPEQKVLTANNADLLNKEETARTKLGVYNGVQIPEKKMTAKDDVTPNAEKALGSYREVSALQDKTISFKFTAFLDSTWDKIKEKMGEKGNLITGNYAQGTNYHKGGLALVNDQTGSKYKELVKLPNGNAFVPQERNTLLNLPRGSSVLKASQTAKLIPRYAAGIGEVITPDTKTDELIQAINNLILTFNAMSTSADAVGTMTEKSVIPGTQRNVDLTAFTPEQLIKQGDQYAPIGSMWLTNLMNGWNSIVPTYLKSETIFISNYLTQLKNQNNPNYLQGITWNRNLMNGWNSLTGTFINVINAFCNQTMVTLRNYNTPMYNNGRTWQQNNLNGWNSLYGSFIARVNQLGNDSINNLRSKNGGFNSAGSYLMQSLINGLNSMGGSLSTTMNGVANKMVGGIGKGVNGVIGGVNYVLKEVESDKKLGNWTVPQYAKGTDGHPGGLAMINDQKGPVHEEYVQMPDGRGFIAKGKDLLVNLPKGAQVLNASLTKKLKKGFDIPHYANGTDDFDIFDLIDDEGAFKKLVDGRVDYNSILEPWKNMTKAGVKLMTSSAYPFVQKEIEENFSTGEFDGSIFQGEGNFNGVYAYLVEVAKKVMAKFPGLIPTSGYRPGDVYHHGKHQAIDISGYPVGSPRYTAAANYAFEKFPRDVGYVITNGRVRDRIGFSGTGVHDGWATWPDGDHFDHVHISGSKGAGDIFTGGSNSPRKSPKPTGSHENWMRLAGFKPSEYSAINYIVNHESSWNPSATNPSSGAYGLPQSLPASKLASAGSDWRTNPITQLRWMRDYVNERYGGANGALAFWQRNHWYANGGLINKDGLYRAGEGNKPEMVIPLTRKTRAIELMGQALAFMSGDNKQSNTQSSSTDNTDELVTLIKQQQRQHSDLMRILKAILSKDSGITSDAVGKAANEFLGGDLSKLGYTGGGF